MTGYEAWERRSRFNLPSIPANVRTRLNVVRYLSQLPEAVIGRRHGEALFRADWGWVKMSLRPYLNAVADIGMNPRRILDLACGDGLVTCFYAVLFPDAEVVALDGCKLCLTTTRSIASRLGLKNLRIVEGDASQLSTIFSGQHFDVIISRSLVLHRLLHPPADQPLGDDECSLPTMREVARASRALLSPGGLFISTERWDCAGDLEYWASTVADAGFLIDWSVSRSLAPTRAASRRRQFMLVARAMKSPVPIAPGEVLTFLANEESATGTQRPTFTGYTAAALLDALGDRPLLFGFEGRRSGFVLRRRLLDGGALIVQYDSTNWHERELSFWPRRAGGELRSQLETEALRLESQGWEVAYLLQQPEPSDRQSMEGVG